MRYKCKDCKHCVEDWSYLVFSDWFCSIHYFFPQGEQEQYSDPCDDFEMDYETWINEDFQEDIDYEMGF